MTLDSLIAVFKALNQANARYLVAGGVAVNLHGYSRATQDLDLVVALSPDNALAAMRALAGLGYRPQVPVAIEDFADADRRTEWITDKNMEVFSVISDQYPDTTVDVFVSEPFPFDDEFGLAEAYEVEPGVVVKVVRPQALIAMKRAAGRDRDRDDIQHLEWILEERKKGEGHD